MMTIRSLPSNLNGFRGAGTTATPAAGKSHPPAGSGPGAWPGRAAVRTGEEIPQCQPGMGLAVRFPGHRALPGRREWRVAATLSPRDRCAESATEGGATIDLQVENLNICRSGDQR